MDIRECGTKGASFLVVRLVGDIVDWVIIRIKNRRPRNLTETRLLIGSTAVLFGTDDGANIGRCMCRECLKLWRKNTAPCEERIHSAN